MRTEDEMEKARARRRQEKQRRWDETATARKERAMRREIRESQAARGRDAAGCPPGGDGPKRPKFLVHWETWDAHRWQWRLFETKEEARAFAKALPRDGLWVYGVSEL